MNDASTPLDALKDALKSFNEARGWGRFHTARDLAMAVTVEAGELLELFLWKPPEAMPEAERLGEEMADVLICLVNLARRADIDLMAVAEAKIAKNALKYPVAKAHGNAKKWDELAREEG
jgi:NTP pyrophosphatase (non-canonical NTP hydrolase)